MVRTTSMISSAGGNFEIFLRHQEQMAMNDFLHYQWHLETGVAQELFPDTKTGKYFSQQVVAGELAGDFVQRLLRFAQFFGHQFAGTIIL